MDSLFVGKLLDFIALMNDIRQDILLSTKLTREGNLIMPLSRNSRSYCQKAWTIDLHKLFLGRIFQEQVVTTWFQIPYS